MYRWLLVLLLALLPVQFIWASVAVYCMHETAPVQVRHLGHHEHEHQATNADQAAVDGDKATIGSDIDCGICHGLGVGMLFPMDAMLISTEIVSMGSQHSPVVLPMPLIPPERPQWRILA